MQILNVIYVIAAVVFLFGAAIFVHEYGHFWMARRRGLKIERFSIGFGPKICGWQKDGIDYAWRWIPAGGSVVLPQLVLAEALEGKSQSAEPLPPISPWSKILVSFAGPFMNVVFAFVIATFIYFVGLPVPVNPPIIGYVEPGSAEAALGIQEGDVIVQVAGKPIKSWEDVQETTILARTNVLAVVIERNGVRTTYQLTTIISEGFGLKVLNLDPRDHPVIKEVKDGSAAQAAGLQVEDVIVSFAKIPIAGRDQFIKLVQARPGEPTEIMVKRGEGKLTLTITPKLNPATNKGLIGAQIGNSNKLVYQIQRPGPTPWAQIKRVFEQTVNTFSALLHSKETGVGAKDMSGPIGILAMLAAQVNIDYRLALSFLVLLNVNLAFINLLPFPVLDGGHILLAIIERIRRRPMNVKVLEYAFTAFAVLLISFMLYVTFFDLKRIPLFHALFKRELQIEQPEKMPPPTSPATNQP
jgi:regulator of sigma E protease